MARKDQEIADATQAYAHAVESEDLFAQAVSYNQSPATVSPLFVDSGPGPRSLCNETIADPTFDVFWESECLNRGAIVFD
jgi:hypothetical protein